MLLTLTSTAPDATGLGFLLHKHPDRVQRFELAFGAATVFYPEASDERCTAALLLEVDPVGLVRNRRLGADGFELAQYVNDRPYAASSMLAVALGRVFNTALNGRCDARPELAATPLPLQIRVPAVPAHLDVRALFEPLGWAVAVDERPPYADLRLTGTVRVADALSHLYVLLPVLDGAKHYWVTSDEVEKLVRRGEGWLATHPLRDLITRRYLRRRRLIADATARLDALDDSAPEAAGDAADAGDSGGAAGPASLRERRLAAVLDVLREVGAHRVVDLGCGEGLYLRAMLAEPSFTEIVGVDVSARELARAEARLGLDRLPDHQRSRITLRQSSATYRDPALSGYDTVCLVEVIEHLDADRLPALERSVFAHARPAHVIVTTPNAEYNAVYGLAPGALRHRDHRFEWTREQFGAWASGVALRHGYPVELRGVGEPHPDHGTPTQLALFTRREVAP